MFKTHEINLAQIKATVEAFGICWFHGCGNLYATQEDSDFRRDFSNPKNEESAYRVKFTRVEQVPKTVDELNQLLLQSRNKELMESRLPKNISGIKTVSVPEPTSIPVITDDEELRQLIEAEEKGKANKRK